MGKIRYQFLPDGGVEEIHKVVFYKFNMGDVEDPQLYAAQPLYEWQQSEPGQYVMKNAVDTPVWNTGPDTATWGYYVVVTAEMEAKKLTEYYLRWGDPNVRNN
jgi:hypothetical protein